MDREQAMRDENGEFEEGLRQALGRKPAPAGFAERVMARVAAEQVGPRLMRPASRWRWNGYRALAAGIVVAVAATMTGGYLQHQHQERVQGENARQQVMLALRITAVTLESVDDKINEGDNNANSSGDKKSVQTQGNGKEEQP